MDIRHLVLLTAAVFLSCSSDLSTSDRERVARLIREWSPKHGLGPSYAAHKEWITTTDSVYATQKNRVRRLEALEAVRIDSIEDAPLAKPLKDALRSFSHSLGERVLLDCSLSPVTKRLKPSYVTHPTAQGDSLLLLARRFLHEIDSNDVAIATHAQSINRLVRSFGLADTIQYERFLTSRKDIVCTYYWFLAPEVRRYLLSSQ
jgi:hypothetical protein